MSALKVLGIMSGTSLDGIDYVLCEISPRRIKFLRLWHRAFSSELRARLEAAATGLLTSHALGRLHHDLGRFYASACPRVAGLNLIGLHGQTVFHDALNRATLQLGESAWLAERFGVPVVSNFRAADLAAGGEGAPLATLFHQKVFGRAGRHVCVNNLGGISNVTSLDQRANTPIQAFDTGPGNMLLDLGARYVTKGRLAFDQGGKLAARGQPNSALIQKWLRHPFFHRKPPKSTGRELFGQTFFAQILRESKRSNCTGGNLLSTLAWFTAESMLLNYRLHLGSDPDEVVLAGGGARNPYLVAIIREVFQRTFPGVSVLTCDKRGWKPDAVEGAAFALLADLAWRGVPGNLPSTTGARHAVVLGQIANPKNQGFPDCLD